MSMKKFPKCHQNKKRNTQFVFSHSHIRCDYLYFKVQKHNKLCEIIHGWKEGIGFRIISFLSGGCFSLACAYYAQVSLSL